jgi:hypothetical protein
LTLHAKARDFQERRYVAGTLIEQLLAANPFTTLQVVLEPMGSPQSLTPAVLEHFWAACLKQPTYLDRYYALQPGRPIGAKRLVVVLPTVERARLSDAWLEEIEKRAAIVWCGHGDGQSPSVWTSRSTTGSPSAKEW